MAKHKTLQQKKLADLRRQHFVYSLEGKELATAVKPVSAVSLNQAATVASKTVAIANYSYVKHDIFKTGILTLSIIGVQLVLLFLLKKHILSFPGISY